MHGIISLKVDLFKNNPLRERQALTDITSVHSQVFRVVASLSIRTHCYPGIHCIVRQGVPLGGDELSLGGHVCSAAPTNDHLLLYLPSRLKKIKTGCLTHLKCRNSTCCNCIPSTQRHCKTTLHWCCVKHVKYLHSLKRNLFLLWMGHVKMY